MIDVISFNNPQTKKEEELPQGLNFNFFTGVPAEDYNISATSKTKKPSRKSGKILEGHELITAEGTSDLPVYQTNEPYLGSYDETNNMLKGAVRQIDGLSSEIKTDLDSIRNNKLLKGKYNYIPLLAGTLSSLMGTKITAIREINKTINDCHNLELKRMKDLKIGANGAPADDDKSIMDMYNAFVSMPIGVGGNMLAPPIGDMTMLHGTQGIIRADLGSMDYGNYTNNISQTQNTMRYERNSDVQTVVIYDPNTGARYFDVMDTKTGISIPNVSKPDQMFLEDTVLDLNNNKATNSNLNQSYPLIIINQNSTMAKY